MNKYIVPKCQCLGRDNQCKAMEFMYIECQDRQATGENYCWFKAIQEGTDEYEIEYINDAAAV